MMRTTVLSAPGAVAVNKYLLPHERQVTSVRQHPAILIGPIVLVVAGLLAAIIINAMVLPGKTDYILAAWAAWLILLLRMAVQIANWTVSFLVVTSERILMVTGALTRRIAIISLSTVNDLSYQRSFGGRLLGYGSFVVTSGAPDQILQKLEYIPYPEELYLRICAVLFPAARVTCPVCHGDGKLFQLPEEQGRAAPETYDYLLADELEQTGEDLLARGYREIVCSRCGGSGRVISPEE